MAENGSVYRSMSVNPETQKIIHIQLLPRLVSITESMAVACLTIGFVPTEGLRWSESQHSVSPMPRARGGDRDGTVAGASGSLPNILLNPNPSWSRQRELLMHLLPWYTAAAAAAQAQPGNHTVPSPGLSSFSREAPATQLV